MTKIAAIAGIALIGSVLFAVSPLHYVEQASAQNDPWWIAWVRADGQGRQPFFYGRGSTEVDARDRAMQQCRSTTGRNCSFRMVAQGRCVPLNLRDGQQRKPKDC